MLPRDRFRELIASEPAVRDALLASLAAEFRRLTIHVEELHFLDITGASRRGSSASPKRPGHVADGGSIRLRSSLTQGDLASMVGCTRQSVNKLLGQFADDGLVRLDREGIVVIDLTDCRRPRRGAVRGAHARPRSASEQDRRRGEGRPRAAHRRPVRKTSRVGRGVHRAA